MLFRLSLGSPGESIGRHWFGDFDGHPMPRLRDGSSLVNLVSIDMTAIPRSERDVWPARLYFPWRFNSEFGMTDTNYFHVTPAGIAALTGLDAQSYRSDTPLDPQPIHLIPTSPAEVEDQWPVWLLGDAPVSRYYGPSFAIPCFGCQQPVRFLLQLSSGASSPFLVFDGETLYYGWCSRCQILAVEAHTQ
jgi:hypothetical protein